MKCPHCGKSVSVEDDSVEVELPATVRSALLKALQEAEVEVESDASPDAED